MSSFAGNASLSLLSDVQHVIHASDYIQLSHGYDFFSMGCAAIKYMAGVQTDIYLSLNLLQPHLNVWYLCTERQSFHNKTVETYSTFIYCQGCMRIIF